MLTAEELGQIRRLHLQLQRRVDSPFAGQYRSAFRGMGMEFEEVRPYVPGDDVRHIDWNVTARAGAPFIKQFREERELTLILVIDLSGSMRVGSGGRGGGTDKRLQTARIAGALALAAQRNGDHVGMVAFSDDVVQVLAPRRDRGHAWQVLRAAFAPPPAARGTGLTGALERVGALSRRRAVVVVLSDFCAEGPWERPLRLLCGRHHVNAFLVHDPLEESLPAGLGLIELEDAETGARRLVDAAAFGRRRPLDERARDLRRAGAACTPVSTADDPFHLLAMHFARLERLR
jgi:uncharacterized protein (DUF58 family)